jgi:toxin-antitoxin system PIN domain toxin
MLLIDVNVLVYAHRRDAADHEKYRAWLEAAIGGNEAFGISDVILSGFLRVATHPRVFDPPSSIEEALSFVEEIRAQPNCLQVGPGPRHWEIFTGLCRSARARGNLVPDAYLAAMAIETGCEWITTDRGFARYPGLRWRHPLERSSR